MRRISLICRQRNPCDQRAERTERSRYPQLAILGQQRLPPVAHPEWDAAGGSMKVKHAKRLDEQDHRSLALWAADCAEHVLPCFEEQFPRDNRPREAIEAARAWARGEIGMSEARTAAFAAHAAARDADHAAARAAARAAGHAVATAHVAGHARHAAAYAVTAATAAAIPTDPSAATDTERDWQYRRLPEHLRSAAFPARGNS